MEQERIIEHLVQIERQQAGMSTKLDELASDMQKLCSIVEQHSAGINGYGYRLSYVEKKVEKLEEVAEEHRAAVNSLRGMRIVVSGIITILAAAGTALGYFLWR